MDIYIVKDNLINNLCTGIIPHILDGFTSIYEDAVRVNPRNPFEQNKRFLLDIKSWPERIIIRESKRVVNEFKMLRKVLKTINYINIKSLALIGKHNISVDDAYVSQNTPSVVTFIHINDDTEDSLTTVVLKDVNEEVLQNDDKLEEDTIVIENTRDNNHSIIKDDDLDMLEQSINQSSIDRSSTNFLDKKLKEDETESVVNEHGFSELMEKTGMNLLDTSSKMEPSNNNINVAASIVSPTMNSSSGKSQTVLLQPSFVNNGKEESSSKVSKSEKKMVSLRKKKSVK